MKPQRDLGANLLKIVLKTKNKKAPANHASAFAENRAIYTVSYRKSGHIGPIYALISAIMARLSTNFALYLHECNWDEE